MRMFYIDEIDGRDQFNQPNGAKHLMHGRKGAIWVN
jgi:hypothetical protein